MRQQNKRSNLQLFVFLSVCGSIMLVLVYSFYGRSPQEVDDQKVESLFSDPQVVKLVLAAENGDVEAIDTLVNSGVDVNSTGRHKVTPLSRSLLARNKDGFKALLRHGANPNIPDRHGYAVIFTVAELEDPFWLAEVLKHGGNPNLVIERSQFWPGGTPVFLAINEGRIENVKLLIAAKANVNHKCNEKSRTFPLLDAAYRQHYDIVYLLLESGADVHQKNAYGDTIVQYFSGRGVEFAEHIRDDQKVWFDRAHSQVIRRAQQR